MRLSVAGHGQERLVHVDSTRECQIVVVAEIGSTRTEDVEGIVRDDGIDGSRGTLLWAVSDAREASGCHDGEI